jgi:hypothetical protein
MSIMTTGHGRRGGSVEYRGALRYVATRYRYTSPPEPGTIVGPRDITREHLVALTTDPDGWTLFGYATHKDLEAALTNAYLNGPRSLNERVASRLFPPLLFRGA